MTTLFGHLWVTNQGQPDDNGNPTENFISWCEATKHFTEKHWKRAYERIVYQKKEAARTGGKAYPPDIVSFVQYGEPVNHRSQNYFDDVVWKIDPITGENKPYRVAVIEDQAEKERRYKKGAVESSKILSMFD